MEVDPARRSPRTEGTTHAERLSSPPLSLDHNNDGKADTDESLDSLPSSDCAWSVTSDEDAYDRGAVLTAADLEICQQLDQQYEAALEEREIVYTARYNSVRQSACFAILFMAVYLTLGTFFFLREANWDVADSLLFSIYTITTVGYGNLEHPETPSFQLYTIFFIFIGIATLTIMVAQVYQCLALEASRAQHARDKTELARRGADAIVRRRGSSQERPSPPPTNVEIILMQPHSHERLWQCLDRTRHFFTRNEFGRSLSVLFPFLGLILIGAIVIGPIEGWTVVESLYFAVVSLTTVGFGDYYPTRMASIWFCILWLPFSIGFMSLFLANVAAFYIRLSDKNVARIERHLRRQIERAKERAEQERAAARRRALRGQEHRDALSDDGEDNNNSNGEPVKSRPTVSIELVGNNERRRRKRSGFDTVPTNEKDALHRRTHLFGSKESPNSQNRRELILKNSIRARSLPSSTSRVSNSGYASSDDEAAVPAVGSTMATMRDVLRTVRKNMAPNNFKRTGPESEYLNIRSSKTVRQSLECNSILKPSFALRALVQERVSEIIALEIAGYSSNIEIHDNTLSVTMDVMRHVADKWLIPRKARRAFRAVAFETLYFVGEHGLITRGAQALYDLSPIEFHALFAPLLAALGDAETMEGWLAETEVLSSVELYSNDDSGKPASSTAVEDSATEDERSLT